jgi:hypothetical protein
MKAAKNSVLRKRRFIAGKCFSASTLFFQLTIGSALAVGSASYSMSTEPALHSSFGTLPFCTSLAVMAGLTPSCVRNLALRLLEFLEEALTLKRSIRTVDG